MEKIMPVSDMRYYNQKLSDVCEGAPVILTRNGKAAYAVVDIDEWRKTQAELRLFEELHKGYQSLKDETSYTLSDLEEHLGVSLD